jgi:hypothetical protein
VTAFSRDIAKLYVEETVQKLHRVKLCPKAKETEIRDLAKLLASVYRKEKARDWVCAPG